MKRKTSIRTTLVGQLSTLKKAYAKDVEALLEILFPRIHAGEFGRDLGEIGEVFETDEEENETPSTEAMYALSAALGEIEFVDRDSFDNLVVACSRYRDEMPSGDVSVSSMWCLARDIRDAYLSRLARLSFRSTEVIDGGPPPAR